MQKGHILEFPCVSCKEPVRFSIFGLSETSGTVPCPSCNKIYDFHDENLQRQLFKFEKLCRQIVESEEILSNTSVGIDVDGRQVQIPYKILLARMTSNLELSIGGEKVMIQFRFEPLHETPKPVKAKRNDDSPIKVPIHE